MPREPWKPKVERQPEFNPFTNVDQGRGPLTDPEEIRDAEEDSAPLQGTQDVSDDDSLEDVISDANDQGKPTPRR